MTLSSSYPWVGIGCSDRGQHPWISLGSLGLEYGLLRANKFATHGAIGLRRRDECVWLDHLDPHKAEYRVHMRCPRCRREVQLRHQRAVDVVTQLHAAEIVNLDISLIP